MNWPMPINRLFFLFIFPPSSLTVTSEKKKELSFRSLTDPLPLWFFLLRLEAPSSPWDDVRPFVDGLTVCSIEATGVSARRSEKAGRVGDRNGEA